MNSLRNLTFFDIYEKNAIFNGKNPALFWNSTDISYKDLYSDAARLASGLKSLKLESGTRIAVLCKNHPVFFHLFGAASALNLTLVLINRRLNEEEVEFIVKDTTPDVIFCDADMANQAQELTKKFSFLKHYFIADTDHTAFHALYKGPEITKTRLVEPTDPFVIIHTAAVKGKPRGAVLSQENIILANQQIIQAYDLDSSKTCLNILPLFHIMGINLGLGILQAGGRNIVIEKFNPKQTLELIQEQNATLFGSFPPILSNLLEAQKGNGYDLSSLEITAGLEMPDTAKKWEALTDSKFWTMYGQTETSGLITFAEIFEKSGSAGKISPLVNIKITNEYDQPLAFGETGEILVRGPLVFQGYWNQDDLNRHTFRNGWHHTGDLGMLDTDGFLFFKGRKAEKELIKPGGENVFPAEVEKTILEHESVEAVCVFGVPDPEFGEGIKAVCSLKKGSKLSRDDLIAFCGSRIAGYKKPRYVAFISDLPKAEDGSIDREKIKTEYA